MTIQQSNERQVKIAAQLYDIRDKAHRNDGDGGRQGQDTNPKRHTA